MNLRSEEDSPSNCGDVITDNSCVKPSEPGLADLGTAEAQTEESEAAKYIQEGDSIAVDQVLEGSSSEEEEEEDDDDDGDGWITPSNIKQVKASMGDVNMEKAAVTVGCITLDFAMQVSLIPVGISIAKAVSAFTNMFPKASYFWG